jgi:HlyD family secretion protein
VDGIVIDRKVDVGQTVAASMSAPVLFQIANDLSRMQINASVAEADVGSVVQDQMVEFTVDAFPYRKFHGKVTQVRNSPITVQNVVTYDTIIEVNNDDLKLKPGMTANVSIVIAKREGVLTVPNSVLRFRPPESAAPKASTNAPVQVAAAGERPAAAAGAGQGGGGQGGGERRRGQGGGGERGGGGGGGGNRQRGESRPPRMIYTLAADLTKATPADLKPNPVKLGISDSLVTEVVEGLNEGDVVVVSMTTGEAAAAPVSSPFGGGGFPRR